MDTASLKAFATKARTDLMKGVAARLEVVLAPGSNARAEQPGSIAALERAVAQTSREEVVDRVAYTWFNRIIALRFMDANGYNGVGVVSPGAGKSNGQPQILSEAKGGDFDVEVVSAKTQTAVTALLAPGAHGADPQGAAYGLLLEAYCRFWNKAMPFMFEREGDYTELLMPTGLLSSDSVRGRAVTVLTGEVCEDVEVIGWLYQFYISERKDEVFEGFKKNKKAGAAEIPAATQLFTPHWIVRYLVENSLGRLWLLNHPQSHLAEKLDYYIAPIEEETDFLKISKPEELKVIDPAVGSGHMLSYAFDLLYAIYEEEGYTPSEIPGLIIEHNLYGAEIDPRAGALAAFALTMKAAARRKLFLKNPVEPNICVLQNVSFDPFELDYLWSLTKGSSIARADADEFWNAFERADTFGSLIHANEELIPALKSIVEGAPADGELFHGKSLDKAVAVLEQATYLSQKYSVVVANPPYMGSPNMNDALLVFGREHYAAAKSDLMTMFVVRAVELVEVGGIATLVTRDAWMFLARFIDFREWLIADTSIRGMAHFGQGIFEGMTGAVVQVVGFSLTSRSAGTSGTYVRLGELSGNVAKDAELRRAARDPGRPSRFQRDQTMFVGLPGSPIAYWASDALLGTFSSDRKVEDISPVRQGFQTGDNNRFMRFWHEVSLSKIKSDATSTEEFQAAGAKWAPYLKGGGFRKWFGNDDYVVAFDPPNYDLLATLGNKLPSRHLYFKESVTWSALSSGAFGARYAGIGSTFSAKGACAFPTSPYARDLVLAVFNSSVTRDLLEFMGATLDFNVGSLRQIPVPPELADGDRDRLGVLVSALVVSHRSDWESDEVAMGFERPALAKGLPGQSLKVMAEDVAQAWQVRASEVESQQDELDELVACAYGLQGRQGLPVTLRTNLGKDAAVRMAISDLVSFAVGCMFGRYSLDKPGLVLADQGGSLRDYLAQVPTPSLMPDADNVIPIVDGDWFEDDIVAKCRQFLRTAFGEQHFAENLTFVMDSLGVKDLRDYFTKSFFKDHVQRYKKRPIYWLFSSPKGSFNALVYLHRYSSSTVSTVLNDYLREFIKKLEVELTKQEHVVANGAGAREVAASQKEADRIRKVLIELNDYERELYDLAAQQIPLDLDDGVLVNYQKFGTALKDIGLKKGGGDE